MSRHDMVAWIYQLPPYAPCPPAGILLSCYGLALMGQSTLRRRREVMVTRYIRGWKDIAKQLRVTVRHAHRLEETKALPVRRDAQIREVRIRKDELEDWRGKTD